MKPRRTLNCIERRGCCCCCCCCCDRQMVGLCGCVSGTFRIPLLFSGLRPFVYLVRMGAGRRAKLIHPLRSQPGVSDANSPVSRRQQIMFRATLIFHLIDRLLSTTAAHEVRRAGVLTCGSCRLERSARPHPHRG